MRRATIMSILQQTLNGPLPVLNKVCKNIVPGPVITIEFDDGTSAVCDLLIACDGARSAVRSMLFAETEPSSRSSPSKRAPDNAGFRSSESWAFGGVASIPLQFPPVHDPTAPEQVLQPPSPEYSNPPLPGTPTPLS